MRKLSLVCFVLLLGTGLLFSQANTTESGSAAPSAQQHPDVPPSQPVDQTNQNNPATTPDSSQPQNQPASPQDSAQSAQSASANDIPAGTQIKATLDQALSTKTSHPGDQFMATIAQPVRDTNGVTVIPAGAKIHGEITEAEQGRALPELRGKGRLNMRFRSIELSNGATVPLTASLVSVNSTSKSGKPSTGQEGEVTSGRSTGQTAKDVGIGAGIGTVAGLIFGHALRGLAIGTIAGGGYVLATQGKDVDLPSETGLVVRVDQNTAVPANTGGR